VAGGPGMAYELTKRGEEGAVHISVYDREKSGRVSEAETEELVRLFLRGITPDEPTEVRVLVEGPDQHRAVARCTSIDPDSGTPLEWLVFAVVWRHHLVMCSCTTSLGSELSGETERMFASIAPAQPPRRGRSRR
jgi:hypothetical protein